MAGTVFQRYNTSWLGKSIERGAYHRGWTCAAVLALGSWLGLAPDVRAETGVSAVSEPAPLASQFVAPQPLSQSSVPTGDGPYFFGLDTKKTKPVVSEPAQPSASTGDDPLAFTQDQQAVPQFNQGTTLDDGTNINFFASPDPDAPLMGGSVRRSSRLGFIRELNANASFNEDQFAYHGGLTMAFVEREGFGIGGRMLFGAASYDDPGIDERQWSFSGDLFSGFRMLTAYGEHWIKGGMFYDWQDHFYKAGPSIAGLFFANEARPLTLDLALGFGGGDDISFAPARAEMMEVADRDFQLRAGIFLNSTFQVGFSGNFVEFDSPTEYQQYWGVGGFTNFMVGNIRVGLDMTIGEGGVRGFANAAWLFGGPGCPAGRYLVDGQSWMMQPVNRDVALRVRTKGIATTGLVGNIGLVTGTIIFPPRLAIGGDQNLNGVIDPGDTFELDLSVTNTSVVIAQNVGVGQNPTIVGSGATLEMDITGTNFGNIPPGESRTTDQFSDLNITINPGATPGQQFFVEFDLTADGQSGRVRLGPFTVGGLANGQTFSAAN